MTATDVPESGSRTVAKGGGAGDNKLLHLGLVALRILPGVILFHGISKAMNFSGFVQTVAKAPLGSAAPTLFAALVVMGEILLPIAVALGFFTRISAFLESFMMFFIWLLVPVQAAVAKRGNLADIISPTGGPVGENAVAYLFALVPLILTGAGVHSFDHRMIKSAPEGSFWAKFKKFV